MLSLRSFRFGSTTAATLAAVIALLGAALMLGQPQAVSAQSCGYYGTGTYGSTYGSTCGTAGYGACAGGGYSIGCPGSFNSGNNCSTTLFVGQSCNNYGNYSNYGNYGNSGCGGSLFSSQSCIGGTGTCVGKVLQAGQSCSNGVISCAPTTPGATATTSCYSGPSGTPYNAATGSTGITAGSAYCAQTKTYVPVQTCIGTGAGGTYTPATSSAASQGTTCPDGTYVYAGQSCQSASSSASTANTSASGAASGNAMNLKSGWNLVGGPAGASLNGVSGSIFTLQAGDSQYETVSATTPFKGGAGYWVNVTGNATLTLPTVSGGNASVQLPAGQWVMIGNPGDTSATVSGADSVLVYDPTSSNYTQSTTLPAGAGGWAKADAGGTATITNTSS